jgi:gluconate kinase
MFENHKKSQYSQGYDPKFKEPETIEILETAKDAIIGGYKKNTIAKLLCNELDMKYEQAQFIAAKAWRDVMKTGKEREDGLKERNMQRLEFIYAEAMKNGDLKAANTAIDLLNKMGQFYKEKVELSTDDFEFVIGGE